MDYLKFLIKGFTAFPVIFLFFYSCSSPGLNRDFTPYTEFRHLNGFFADPVVFFESDNGKARLDLYIEIPGDNIFYKKNINNEKYESNITLTVNIKNSAGNKVVSESYNEYSAFSEDEMKKKSKESQYYLYNYFIVPGNYNLEIKISDKNSENVLKKSADFSVSDFSSKEVSFSNLLILSKYKMNKDGTKEITPLINNNLFGLKEFFVFFEIYNKNDNNITKEYVYKLKDNKNVILKEEVLTYTLSPGKNQEVINVFAAKELKNYFPEEPDFDFFLYDNDNNISFDFEIIDKSNNEITAVKKLNFIPIMIKHKIHRKQHNMY